MNEKDRNLTKLVNLQLLLIFLPAELNRLNSTIYKARTNAAGTLVVYNIPNYSNANVELNMKFNKSSGSYNSTSSINITQSAYYSSCSNRSISTLISEDKTLDYSDLVAQLSPQGVGIDIAGYILLMALLPAFWMVYNT